MYSSWRLFKHQKKTSFRRKLQRLARRARYRVKRRHERFQRWYKRTKYHEDQREAQLQRINHRNHIEWYYSPREVQKRQDARRFRLSDRWESVRPYVLRNVFTPIANSDFRRNSYAAGASNRHFRALCVRAFRTRTRESQRKVMDFGSGVLGLTSAQVHARQRAIDSHLSKGNKVKV